jgi:hypothetical protein
MAKLHYTNKLANLCNITNELVGLWQDQRPTSGLARALARANKLAQQVGSVEFISQQVVQQVRVCVVHQTRTCWPTSCQLVGQLVRIEFGHLHVDRCSFSRFLYIGGVGKNGGGWAGGTERRKKRKVNYDEGRR